MELMMGAVSTCLGITMKEFSFSSITSSFPLLRSDQRWCCSEALTAGVLVPGCQSLGLAGSTLVMAEEIHTNLDEPTAWQFFPALFPPSQVGSGQTNRPTA